MDKKFGIISACPLFSGLPDNHLKELQNIAVDKSFKKNESIFFEGDDGEGFYLIVSGKVKIFKLSMEGKEKILHILDSGEPFGEVAVFSGKRFPANAGSLTQTNLLFFPRDDFVKLIANNPALSLNMLSVLSKRLKQFSVQIEGLSLKDLPGRLAVYLLSLGKSQENYDHVTLNITKGQLASLLGTIPETLSRIMAKMNIHELIEVTGRQIKILDYNGLEDLAETGRFIDD
ncbi:Crp/Fnr family transcriptional regulator [bacterium]|nr:Crp/Fnr family transcriptional regulator [bacterium]